MVLEVVVVSITTAADIISSRTRGSRNSYNSRNNAVGKTVAQSVVKEVEHVSVVVDTEITGVVAYLVCNQRINSGIGFGHSINMF